MHNNIQNFLEQMEIKHANSIQQIKSEATKNEIELQKYISDKANKQILTKIDYEQTNSDIRWQFSENSDFSDENIIDLYLNNSYFKATRWDLYLNIIESMKKYKISNNIDIGAGNNHFSFLAKKSNISSYGVEPRRAVLFSCDETFKKNFGTNQRFGFVGSLKTFSDFILNQENKVEIDCVTVLNFLHGQMHISNEIERFFLAISKTAKYAVFSNPHWESLNLSGVPENFSIIETFNCASSTGVAPHFLYKINS